MTDSEAGHTHYFIYYRIRPNSDHAHARATIRAMQAGLAKRTGIAGRLMERCGDDATWMEIYESVADRVAFDVALDIEAEAHRLSALIEPGSTRHVERFVECA